MSNPFNGTLAAKYFSDGAGALELPPYSVKSGGADASQDEEHAAKPRQEEQRASGGPETGDDMGLRWHGDATTMAPRSWLVADLVPETGSGFLSAQWGLGKTFAALDLSASVMTGTPFAGRPVARKGGVLFVAAEGASEIPVRLRGLAKHKLGLADTDRLPFAWVEDANLKSGFTRLVAQAKAAAEGMQERFGLPLALIVVDTLNAAAEFSDGNDAAEAQKVMNRLADLSRKTGAFLLAVDHFGKMVETGTRGSSAKEAAADMVLAVLGDRDIAGAVSNTRMAVRKLRGGTCGGETPFRLQVVPVGEETTCIVDWSAEAVSAAEASTSKDKWPKSLRVLKAALVEVLAIEGKPRRPFGFEGPEVKTAPLTSVRKEFFKAYPADGDDERAIAATKRAAFNRAITSARHDSLIGSREIGGEDHVWLIGGLEDAGRSDAGSRETTRSTEDMQSDGPECERTAQNPSPVSRSFASGAFNDPYAGVPFAAGIGANPIDCGADPANERDISLDECSVRSHSETDIQSGDAPDGQDKTLDPCPVRPGNEPAQIDLEDAIAAVVAEDAGSASVVEITTAASDPAVSEREPASLAATSELLPPPEAVTLDMEQGRMIQMADHGKQVAAVRTLAWRRRLKLEQPHFEDRPRFNVYDPEAEKDLFASDDIAEVEVFLRGIKAERRGGQNVEG